MPPRGKPSIKWEHYMLLSFTAKLGVKFAQKRLDNGIMISYDNLLYNK